MRALGWIEGQNLAYENRFIGNDIATLRPFAEELVRLKVDVIVTLGTEAALAAKNATTTIPIVMASIGDPVGTGLVASLAHPGGNITGFSLLTPEIETKRAALLHELLPAVQRVAVMINPRNRLVARMRKWIEEAYAALGVEPIFLEIADDRQFAGAAAQAVQHGAQALAIELNASPTAVAELMGAAVRYRVPTMAIDRDMLEAGGLICFQYDSDESDRRVAALIDKILRGAKPADIPIEQPTRVTLLLNLRTAKAIGLAIPQSLLLRADDVIR
ncbi:MAG TPA: ABC transporter substrate-binding protein [Casimicrobiaceae bacterium]|nr:ABC transporter substrate-binding protein [Casimicrobiaceae bacterium]